MSHMIPRPEYPRPSLVRPGDTWVNLNGTWEFEIDPCCSGFDRRIWEKPSLPQSILVPFAPESSLSGVEHTDFMRAVWYRRTFTLSAPESRRVLLHFGAVDYRCDVWVNGKHAGFHVGGYTPFVLDITGLVLCGENTLVVAARDDTRDPLQPTGKQSDRFENYGCMYTRTTGIWQTVWLEFVPETYIKSVKLTPDVDNRAVHARVDFAGDANGMELCAEVSFAGTACFAKSVKCQEKSVSFTLSFPDGVSPELWDIGKPALYDLKLRVGEDVVETYFGMRKVCMRGYAFELNDRPVFMRLVLDQGFWQDGIYTAPSDEALRKDIELSMAAGFNGARLHMKIFEPGTIYWADHLGYLLWGEFPNWGLDDSRRDAYLSVQPEFLEELERDYNSPAIIGWCPFNETRPQRCADIYRAMYRDIRAFDPNRPIIDTSGYVHFMTDIYDVHDYEQNPEHFRRRYQDEFLAGQVFRNFPEHETYLPGQPYFVSEFGGTHWDIDCDPADRGWGYGQAPKTLDEFYERFEGLISVLLDSPKICGFCYTQLTDVFQEKNGIYAFDRREKFDTARLCGIVSRKAAIEKDPV